MEMTRSAFAAGHRRKFLVVVDETDECDRAVVYAARRAARTGGVLVLLYVIEDGDFRDFIGVEKVMRAEARAEAEMALERVAKRVRDIAGIDPECAIVEGVPSAAILKMIETDLDIAILVLAAAAGKDGPGPLVAALAGRSAGVFPVPITIVPGHLSDAAIAAIA